MLVTEHSKIPELYLTTTGFASSFFFTIFLFTWVKGSCERSYHGLLLIQLLHSLVQTCPKVIVQVPFRGLAHSDTQFIKIIKNIHCSLLILV